MDLKGYLIGVYILFGALLVGLLVFGNQLAFLLTYGAVFLCTLARTLSMQTKKRIKGYLVVAYAGVLAAQVVLCIQVLFVEKGTFYDQPFRRLFGVLLVLVPLVVSRYVSVGKYAQFYLPSLQDLSTISFAELQRGRERTTRRRKP